MNVNFPVLLIDDPVRVAHLDSPVDGLAAAIERTGLTVLRRSNAADATTLADLSSRVSAFVYCATDDETDELDQARAVEFVEAVRAKNATVPIYLFAGRITATSIPLAVLKDVNGFVNTVEETDDYVARGVAHAARTYLESIAPPFSRMLVIVNSCRGIGPMIPAWLRVGVRKIGIAPVRMIACSTDLWQFRSTTTTSPGLTIAFQTILFDVEVPLVTKYRWSAEKILAALRSASKTGPVWSSSWPRSSTALQTSARSMFSPKNWWNIVPTGLFKNAAPPEWPGACQELAPLST